MCIYIRYVTRYYYDYPGGNNTTYICKSISSREAIQHKDANRSLIAHGYYDDGNNIILRVCTGRYDLGQ